MCLKSIGGVNVAGLNTQAALDIIRIQCEIVYHERFKDIVVEYVIPRNAHVRLKNLKSENGLKLNGSLGRINSFNNGRYDVDLGCGRRLRFLSENLEAAGDPLPAKMVP